MQYPEAVRFIRTSSHLTQQAFAKMLGVSFATINRWENAQQKPSRLALKILDEYCIQNGISVLIEDVD